MVHKIRMYASSGACTPWVGSVICCELETKYKIVCQPQGDVTKISCYLVRVNNNSENLSLFNFFSHACACQTLAQTKAKTKNMATNRVVK